MGMIFASSMNGLNAIDKATHRDHFHMKIANRNIILYFDDHPDISTMVNLAAARAGCVVEFVEQPEVGLAALDSMRPAGIIVDVFMPRMRVEDLLTAFRGAYPDMPVFLITAVPDIQKHAARLQVTAYLTKPFTIEAFVEMIDKHIPLEFRAEVPKSKTPGQ
jgi:DNA-binding NtrC family response regulator